MNIPAFGSRRLPLLAALLVTIALTLSAASPSMADHGRGRWKGGGRGGYGDGGGDRYRGGSGGGYCAPHVSYAPRYYAPRYVYRAPARYYGDAYAPRPRYRSGFSFGITIANGPPPGYYYYDPYCHERFASLGLYLSHLHGCGHPRSIEMVSYDDDDPSYTYDWDGDEWECRE